MPDEDDRGVRVVAQHRGELFKQEALRAVVDASAAGRVYDIVQPAGFRTKGYGHVGCGAAGSTLGIGSRGGEMNDLGLLLEAIAEVEGDGARVEGVT